MDSSAFPVPTPCSCRPNPEDLPVVLLTARVDDDSIDPPLLAATVDYEIGVWRAGALANHIFEWVLDYALRRSEREHLSAGRALEITKRAMQTTFGNGGERGVPGEILLHAMCRQFFGSDTVINKVWFKTAQNDTYKGFDGVHAVHRGDDLELWLGEAKFYKDADRALQSVLDELQDHLDDDYLRCEFALVASKIDDDHPHALELRRLMHPNTSLDEVFDRIVIPVLITYDSSSTLGHTKVCPQYKADLEAEVRRIWLKLKNKLDTRLPVAVRLFLVPLGDKAALQNALDTELQKWQ
jgi:Cap4 SAVED domain